jgi:hypothetical protein
MSDRVSPTTRNREIDSNRTSFRPGATVSLPAIIVSARAGLPCTSRRIASQILENEKPSDEVEAGTVS